MAKRKKTVKGDTIRKDTEKKNSSDFYGEEYLKGTGKVAQMSMGGGKLAPRWENNVAFKNSANMTSDIMRKNGLKTALTVSNGAVVGTIMLRTADQPIATTTGLTIGTTT